MKIGIDVSLDKLSKASSARTSDHKRIEGGVVDKAHPRGVFEAGDTDISKSSSKIYRLHMFWNCLRCSSRRWEINLERKKGLTLQLCPLCVILEFFECLYSSFVVLSPSLCKQTHRKEGSAETPPNKIRPTFVQKYAQYWGD